MHHFFLASAPARLAVLTGVLAAAGSALAWGDSTDTPRKPRRWYDPQRLVEHGQDWIDSIRHIEIVEMLSALAHGQPPGDGKGWFHGGQSRYGWQWLAERYDQNGDGKIVPDEYPPQAAELLRRLDRDENGKIEEQDFNWSSDSPYVKQISQTRRLFGPMDRDRNGQVTQEEWRAFFDRAALDADHITPADLQAALFPPPKEPSDDEPSPLDFVWGFVTGELGSISEGPPLGGRAPDFELPTHDRIQRLRLSTLIGKKPVVLIFGSFT